VKLAVVLTVAARGKAEACGGDLEKWGIFINYAFVSTGRVDRPFDMVDVMDRRSIVLDLHLKWV
jgi:hypothetical protein